MNICFVLGAGASADYKFPLGAGLHDQILTDLVEGNGHRSELLPYLMAAGNSQREVDEFVDCLKHSQYETIDEFVAAHVARSRLQRITRQAVTVRIAQMEKSENLFASKPHWYRLLLQFFRRNPTVLVSDDFRFITFNYDRSLEHYLHKALESGGSPFTSQQIGMFFDSNFYHLHGRVGCLPWQQTNGGDEVSREYGTVIIPTELEKIAQGIITPEQEMELGGDLLGWLMKADLIVILGFAFAEQNCKRIQLELIAKNCGEIRATTNNVVEVAARVTEYGKIHPYSMTCFNFMNEFVRDWEGTGSRPINR